jgi:hypothetical protein
MPYRVNWTPEMIAALRSMRGQGFPLCRCAELIGVGYKTAVVKARELGLQGRQRGDAHRHLEAEPANDLRLRKRWEKQLPSMRDAIKRAAEPDA